jgi:ribulose-phosphate 3-epimerase
VQVDVIDGEFADNITIHPVDLKDMSVGNLSVDIHLMTNDPINDVVECQDVPNMRAVIAQIEHMPSQQDFIEHVKSFGWKVGLSLDLYTEDAEISDEILKQLDIVQVMTVKTGYQNQAFQTSALETVKRVAARLQNINPQCELFVDGGVTAESWKLSKAAGATHAAVGHDLWSAKNVAQEIQTLQSIQ